jgi:LysR family transcriptional regulator, glycine cleavage system transcriptional activator
MKGRFRRVQSLATALPVLESAVRLGSFTRAAVELGLTQPTASRHIQALEARIGQPLFRRDHNRIEATDLARRLAAATALGMGHIEAALAEAMVTPRRALTLATSLTFGNLWLIRRFADLRRAMAPVPVALKMSFWMDDIGESEADIRLDWTVPPPQGAPRVALVPEIVYPVAAPQLAARHGLDPQRAAPLLSAPLLFAEDRDPHTGWRHWFAAQGIGFPEPPGAYRHSGYPFLLQEALDGEGVCLGWHHLVVADIAAGRLVRAGPALRRDDLFLTLDFGAATVAPAVIDTLLAWFRREMAACGGPDGARPD